MTSTFVDVSRFTSASGALPLVFENENLGNVQFRCFSFASVSTSDASGTDISSTDCFTSTLGSLTSALASGNSVGVDIPNFSILNLLPLAFTSSVSTLGDVTSADPSTLMSLSTSGTSTLTFGVVAPNLGNENVGILSFDGDPSTSPVLVSVSGFISTLVDFPFILTSGSCTSALTSGSVTYIQRFISNYIIHDGVIIENVGAIYIENETSFGNGTKVSTIIEGGHRSVKIFNRLDSHTAYIYALYRHNKKLQSNLEELIENYTKEKTKKYGKIKSNAHIVNARLVINTHVDPYTKIENADEIRNTTIISTKECPTYIGTSVIIKDSIILKGAKVIDNSIVVQAFVGEGTKLARQFSCEGSLLFANCEGEHGEVFSVYAGPYTVTHHKSTLLIASHFSFFNAGSGTNQSNHMNK